MKSYVHVSWNNFDTNHKVRGVGLHAYATESQGPHDCTSVTQIEFSQLCLKNRVQCPKIFSACQRKSIFNHWAGAVDVCYRENAEPQWMHKWTIPLFSRTVAVYCVASRPCLNFNTFMIYTNLRISREITITLNHPQRMCVYNCMWNEKQSEWLCLWS